MVLKDFSLKINDGEKIGIVGRTGAGKSSIIQMLFRIVEAESGSYEIGGCDARQMGLHTLRKNLSVLPQTPFLFKGTVRMNLDPFNTKSEDELKAAIKEAGIEQKINTVLLFFYDSCQINWMKTSPTSQKCFPLEKSNCCV